MTVVTGQTGTLRPTLCLSVLLRLFALVVIAAVVARSGTAWSVDPAHTITQYGHRVWRIGEAGLEHEPTTIAQTKDGQIWVGSSDGLYRFDGERFTRWRPANGQAVKFYFIENLFAAPDGDLYVGSDSGLYRISHDTIFKYPEALDNPGPFLQDRYGTVWLVERAGPSVTGVCSVGRTRLKCYRSRDGASCSANDALAISDDLGIWTGGLSHTCRWSHGRPSRVYPLGSAKAPVTAMALDARHSLWASVASGSAATGLWRFQTDTWKHFTAPGLPSRHLNIWGLFGDRRGSLWIEPWGHGLYRLTNGRVDHFDHHDGLSGDVINWVYEDREGSIWVATTRGIDQFFDLPIIPFTAREGLSGDNVASVTPVPDGATLVGQTFSVDSISAAGRVSTFSKLLGMGLFRGLFADSTGLLWEIRDTQLLTLRPSWAGRFTIGAGTTVLRGFRVFGMAEDTRQRVWAAGREDKHPHDVWLWRFNQGRPVDRLRSPVDAGHGSIDAIASDLAGGLWVMAGHHFLYDLHDKIFTRVASLNIVAREWNSQILPVAPAEAWLTTTQGLVWLKDGRTRVLNAESGLPCDDIYGVAFDKHADLWLTTQCGLVEVQATQVERWQKQLQRQVDARVFGPTSGYVGDNRARLVETTNGNIWFAAGASAYELDPTRIPVNALAPPVKVQGVTADQRLYPVSAHITLPKLTRNVEIDYAGLSYVQPDLLDFRYRLLGHDREWTDVGNRRAAFYNDLPPGSYQFQVTACNEDAFCNERGASIVLVIPPAWWQTWWFRTLCAVAIVGLLAAVIRWRLNAYANIMRLRLDDRLEERTRVARDLHDTLMQTVLASKLLAEGGQSFSTIAEGRAVLKRLSEWLGSAADEGRAAVQSLRSFALETNHLKGAFESAAEEGRSDRDPAIRIIVTGQVRELHPIVRDEIHRIGVEAIRNARAHSGASHILVELDYGQSLTLRISDNGCGMDDDVLMAGKANHFGLVGMRERAEHIGAMLTILSSPTGTEVKLVVPGKAVFVGRHGPVGSFRQFWLRLVPMTTKAASEDAQS